MRAEPVMAGSGQPPKASLWQTVKAVLSGFIGIRRASEHSAVTFSPGRVIVVAVICTALFVMALISLVNWVAA